MTDCSSLWPKVDPRLHWGFLAGKLGADPSMPRPFLICLRGVELNAREDHETVAKPAYDDTAILLTRDSEPLAFKFASHAYQLTSSMSPGGVATIRPGRFVLTLATENPYPIWVLTLPNGSGNIPAFRDANHDGHYSEDELDKQTVATAILLHLGWDAPADSAHRSSIGCQTCSLPVMRVIVAATKKTGRALDYVLVNARDAVPLMADFDAGTSPNVA